MTPLAIMQLIIGSAAGAMTIGGCIPQIFLMIKSKSAKSLSWGFLFSCLGCSVFWAAYAALMIPQGVAMKDFMPPLLVNILTTAAFSFKIYLKRRYDGRGGT